MTAVADERVTLSREIAGIGRLDFEQTDKKREYWLLPEGNQRRTRLASVTEILRDTWPGSEALLGWYAKHGFNAREMLKERAAIGTDTHKFIETYLRTGDLLGFSHFKENRKPYLQGAARFLMESQLRAIDVERLVCHPEHRYAGRFDVLGLLKDSDALTLLDFKTQAEGNIYAKAHVQGCGYAMADHRCGGEPIDRIMVVGLADDGSYRLVETPVKEAAQMWRDCLTYYGSMKQLLKALGEA